MIAASSRERYLQQAEGDLGEEGQAVLLEEASRDPRVHGEAQASPQVFNPLGLVVEGRLARHDGLEEESMRPFNVNPQKSVGEGVGGGAWRLDDPRGMVPWLRGLDDG